MARRIGFYSLRKTGHALCKYITLFGPVIQKAYPENLIIGGLLATAYAACSALIAEIETMETPGV